LLVASTIGGYFGALVGKRAPTWAIRAGTLIIAGGTTVAFFARAYFKGGCLCESQSHRILV
jgi:hypothetical protein